MKKLVYTGATNTGGRMIKPRFMKLDKMIEIDLAGPDGNAYMIMALARKLYIKQGYDQDDCDILIKHMKLGDYEHLIEVFDYHFGHCVILYR